MALHPGRGQLQRGGAAEAGFLELDGATAGRQLKQAVNKHARGFGLINARLGGEQQHFDAVLAFALEDRQGRAGRHGHNVFVGRRDGHLLLADAHVIFVRVHPARRAQGFQVQEVVRRIKTDRINTNVHKHPTIPPSWIKPSLTSSLHMVKTA
jgi:hypothetical protein